jgi:hypothetical protein
MSLTQSQFEALITDRLQQDGWEVTRSLITDVMKAQAAVAHEHIAKGETVTIRDICRMVPKFKPKTAKHTGVFFGEERTVAAKPASVVLKVFAKPVAKAATPSTPAAIRKIFGSGEPTPAPKAKAAPKAAAPKPAAARRQGARSKPDATKRARKSGR